MIWMATISIEQVGKNEEPFGNTHAKPLIKQFFKSLKGKWQYGYEKGKDGYLHIQARFEYGYDNTDKTYGEILELGRRILGCGMHIEAAKTSSWRYERKEGHYLTSDDNPERWKVRFSQLLEWQKRVVQMAERQSVREITVFVNPSGNIGKTHLLQHLWEHNRAILVPRHKHTVSEICQSIHNKYNGQTYVVFDLQRQRKLTEDMAEAIEIVKDGIIEDIRYHSDEINIRGTKVIVFTNQFIDYKVLKSLSSDRWKIYTINSTAPPIKVTITAVPLHSNGNVVIDHSDTHNRSTQSINTLMPLHSIVGK